MSWTFAFLGLLSCMNLWLCFLKAETTESHIYFDPPHTEYFLRRGESIPPITCHVTCDIECDDFIWWTKMAANISNSSTLSLGTASLRTSGEYTCNVKGAEKTGYKPVYISVQDDEDANSIQQLRVAVIVLGCVVAMVTVVSIITVLWLCRKKLKCECDEIKMWEKSEFTFDHNITDIVATNDKTSKAEELKLGAEDNSVYYGLKSETMDKAEPRLYGTLEREKRTREQQPETTDDNRSLEEYELPVTAQNKGDQYLDVDDQDNIYDKVEIGTAPSKAGSDTDSQELYENLNISGTKF